MKYSYSALYREAILREFAFLVEKYGYSYEPKGDYYEKNGLRLHVEYVPDGVSIEYWLTSEPEFTSLPISWLLGMRNQKGHPDVPDRASVEEVISICSRFYEDKIETIARELPQLVVPGLKLLFESTLRTTPLSKSQLLGARDYKQIYDYIRLKDPAWDP